VGEKVTNFFEVRPVVDGGWGPETQADTTVHPPVVTKFHYEFDDWGGDCIVTSTPCFVVTSDVAQAITEAGFAGFTLGDVVITMTEDMSVREPPVRLPRFRWLKIVGQARNSDFGLSAQRELVVSERALELLKKFGLGHAVITPYQ
jgi:hypothetical protein